MGSSREGYDLTHAYGRMYFWKALKRDRAQLRRYVFRDNLAWVVCRLSGGCEFTWRPEPNEFPEEFYCCWCHAAKPGVSDAE